MDSQFCSAVEQSATVLTFSDRLSRSLREGYNEYQQSKGRSVWQTPRIWPLDNWLERCWRDWMLARGDDDAPVLLSAVQEAALWESIILESPAGRSLLRIPETASGAMQAWSLLNAYRLPFDRAAFAVNEDCEAFFAWALEFKQRRTSNNWVERANLSDHVAGLTRSGRIERPFPLLFAGFDELTPQQQDLHDALRGSLHTPTQSPAEAPRAVAFKDTQDEIGHAAAWARARLETNSSARIGVIVPAIGAMRSKLNQVFEELLPGAFHLSLGPALRDWPVVNAALLLLELAGGTLEIERLGMILRSPYWKGGEAERSRRAVLDATLRRQENAPVSLEEVRVQADLCPILAHVSSGFEKELRRLPSEQSPSLWSRTFSRLLKQLGWPGDRPLTSSEHQTMEAWNKLLSDFATLDAITIRLDLDAALSRLRSLAANRPFQLKDEGAPVQIAGLLEASGLRFDHLWVMGLHDEEMPPLAQPNPFLPLALQRDRGLPHSSAQRQLDFHRKLLARLAASAPEVVFSYPQWEGDQARGPSPLIQLDTLAAPAQALPPRWMEAIHHSTAVEVFEDRVAPPVSADVKQYGGTSMLKDMAACPFKAFARNRLGARELEDSDLGLNARQKGSGVHKVLEMIWNELKNQNNLLALDSQQLQECIQRNVEQVLKDDGQLGRRLERRRLQRLLTEWLEIEKTRPPFSVLEAEEKRTLTIGDLQIATRIDRVDQLPDGRHIIIDYKTGDVGTDAWAGERLDEPQVPLYCISSGEQIAGAAFAQIRTGGVLMKGVTEHGELGKIYPMRVPKDASMGALIEEWNSALDKLGNAFRTGVADVDPKQKSTCKFCRLTALCRIHDNQPDDNHA